ncbi:MAG: hypothetical protein ACRDPA_06975 [Solirubrobacteraceae bacterium]
MPYNRADQRTGVDEMLSPHRRTALSRQPCRILIALAAVSGALAIAACGSVSKPSTAARNAPSTAVRFADCMRSHGVPSFPDPSPDGFNLSAFDTASPAFQSAHQACAPLQPAGTAQGSPASASERLAAIANAKCMRAHGVPNFPDPKFLPSGGNTVSLDGLNTQSPAFKQAQASCPWPPRTGP